MLFFYQGTPADGRDYFGQLWAEARAVSDLNRQFYQAFGIKRAGMQEILTPSAAVCGLRATLKGNFVSRASGDVRLMPGIFLVRDETVIWKHKFRHIGDHPDFKRMAEEIKSLTPAI